MRNEEFSSILRSLRVEKGLSITDLAEKSGVSRPYLSQIEHGKKSVPSIKIINDLATALEIDNIELAHLAGYYTLDEVRLRSELKNQFNSMTPEEEEEYFKEEYKSVKRITNILQYKEKVHVQIEDFLNNEYRNFYINNHKLSDEDIKILIALYKDRETNYPTDEQIEKEYEEIKKEHEENQKKVDSGESFLIMHPYDDIDTKEDVEHDINANEDK